MKYIKRKVKAWAIAYADEAGNWEIQTYCTGPTKQETAKAWEDLTGFPPGGPAKVVRVTIAVDKT